MKLLKLVLVFAALCAVLALNLTATSPAWADDSLDLVINEGVIVPWEISNIMPGASGVAYVDVRNAGNINGYMAVWIDAITDTEGENPEAETGNTEEPGELSQYLTLNISGESIAPYTSSPDFELPVVLSEFPQSSDHSLQLSDQPLKPGETFQLQWEWAIPPQTTNIIQGDNVSFNINYILTQYLLVQKPPPPTPQNPTPPTYGGGYWKEEPSDLDVEPDTEPDAEAIEQHTNGTGKTAVSDDGEITETYHSPDGKLTVKVIKQTKVISAGNEELLYVGITFLHYTPPIPENNVLLSPIYDLATFTAKGWDEDTQLDKPVTIVIDYDNDKLPEQVSSIYAALYKADSGWIKLTGVREINRTDGKITVVSTQLSPVAVFAEMATAGDSTEVITSASDSSLISGLPDSGAPQSKTDIESIPLVENEPMRETLSQASLAVAVSGTFAMTVLAYIERKRRDNKRTAKL